MKRKIIATIACSRCWCTMSRRKQAKPQHINSEEQPPDAASGERTGGAERPRLRARLMRGGGAGSWGRFPGGFFHPRVSPPAPFPLQALPGADPRLAPGVFLGGLNSPRVFSGGSGLGDRGAQRCPAMLRTLLPHPRSLRRVPPGAAAAGGEPQSLPEAGGIGRMGVKGWGSTGRNYRQLRRGRKRLGLGFLAVFSTLSGLR